MFKNLTVNRISLYVTLILSAINLSVLFVVSKSGNIQPGFVFILVILGSLIVSFLVVRLFLSQLVFNKIRLIYRIIHRSKSGKKTDDEIENGTLPIETDLNKVNEQVVEWAQNTESEIENLKNLEVYRRNFLGNISHELKTPIFSIQGYLHTLLDGGLNDKKINMRYIERAAANAERLQNIVDDLEIINKLENETILDLSKFDIKVLVEEVFRDLELLSKKKKIKLEFDKKQSRSFIVEGDKERIRQVLINLLTNSIKYGDERGQTIVRFIDLEDRVLVEVADNGIGIPEKHLKHVFDRFYRVDTSRSRKLGGSGLGLSIVKHIIEAHNQTIDVKNNESGQGSTFTFSLSKMK